jgi:parallel beta-helix repeat protein
VRNESTDNGDFGILVAEESLDSTLLGNRVSGSGMDGIFVTADSSNITLDGNRADGNADDGIDVDGPGNTLTRNSAFRTSTTALRRRREPSTVGRTRLGRTATRRSAWASAVSNRT